MSKPIRLKVFKDSAGKWRWSAIAGNNRVVDAAEQGYAAKWWARRKARRAYPDGVFR